MTSILWTAADGRSEKSLSQEDRTRRGTCRKKYHSTRGSKEGGVIHRVEKGKYVSPLEGQEKRSQKEKARTFSAQKGKNSMNFHKRRGQLGCTAPLSQKQTPRTGRILKET